MISKAHNIILSEKEWHANMATDMQQLCGGKWTRIDNKKDFNIEKLRKLAPDRIFIPHWSYIIIPEIYQEFECIIFHMTDLPYGRGGTPLQNLIVRGHTTTKISAIRCQDGIDTGPLYMKSPLSLHGTAREIFVRAAAIIQSMIYYVVSENPEPVSQEGDVVLFKRRTPRQSDISNIEDLNKLYDIFRMLDCEGYPNAYLETKTLKIEFSKPQKELKFIKANAIITLLEKKN